MTNGTRLSLYPLDRLAEYAGADAKIASRTFGGIILAHHLRKKEQVPEVLALAAKAGD
jgi:hypothetical protein